MPFPGLRAVARLAMAILVAAAVSPANADLVGLPQPPPLSAAEQAIVAGNPDLGKLVQVNPWVLRVVLDTIATTPRAPAKGMIDLDPADLLLLDANPALAGFNAASPEAAAQLLALIRSAGRPRVEPLPQGK